MVRRKWHINAEMYHFAVICQMWVSERTNERMSNHVNMCEVPSVCAHSLFLSLSRSRFRFFFFRVRASIHFISVVCVFVCFYGCSMHRGKNTSNKQIHLAKIEATWNFQDHTLFCWCFSTNDILWLSCLPFLFFIFYFWHNFPCDCSTRQLRCGNWLCAFWKRIHV